MGSRVGLVASDVRTLVLSGLPLYDTRFQEISDPVLDSLMASAENKVELDLNVLIGTREVRCIHDQSDPLDADDDSVIFPALDKPANWLDGHRNGILMLPKGPVKKILKMGIRNFGSTASILEIDVSQLRFSDKSVYTPPLRYPLLSGGTVGAGNAVSTNVLTQNLVLQSFEGITLPASVEVVYLGGLSARDLKQKPIIKTLILLQAGILALGFLQIRLGGGIQEESAGFDGLDNSVKLARRDMGGPLAGEIAQLKSNYNALLQTARADGGNLGWAFLG